jgi:PleD family two-component response regulator
MVYKLENAKILIVDDMKPMLSLLESLLHTFGFTEIYTAQDGESAFNIFCKYSHDLIITDWVMEPMNGLELIKKIRKDQFSPNKYVPVIIMSGFSARVRVEAARDQGVTEFLVKPFTARDLYSRIEHVIEKPRRFVDASNFFGPDRRRKKGDEYEGPMRREEDQQYLVDHKTTPEEKIAAETLQRLLRETRDKTK